MLRKQKKLSKKEIQEDQLITTISEIKDFYDEHQQKILIIGGAIIVLILAIVLYQNKMVEDNITASNYLAKVMDLYQAKSYQEAIDGQPGTDVIGLKKIVDDYGNTEVGETAKIYLANALEIIGKPDEAFEYYNDYSGSIETLKATALAGAAGYLADNNKLEDAADKYVDAAFISKVNPQNADYLLRASILFIELKKNDSAKKYLNIIKNDYKDTEQAKSVSNYLALL